MASAGSRVRESGARPTAPFRPQPWLRRRGSSRFNEIGLACLDPQRAGGRPRQLTVEDEDFVILTATTRPPELAQPLTRWSIRKLAAHPRRVHGRVIRSGREAWSAGR
ncbi:hypothetical protein GCM10009665_27230 [Kitasatospora nipponensis]|uniref:Uncharacterized protein n=1 Tax=Kitasatospora nipponensis TaxID=258049 RepID=A0ABN1W4T0_9ACTN